MHITPLLVEDASTVRREMVLRRQAETYGRLALYETEDLPYRRDAATFIAEYEKQRKRQHARMMAADEIQQDDNYHADTDAALKC